ncbi:MAG: three-helix bundle dimerization domain-containing protein [Acidimicrobiia bacterium]
MAIAIEPDSEHRVVAEISTSLHEGFGGRIHRREIVELVERELARYAHAPIKDFVPLLVERHVRARLRGNWVRE